MADIGGMLDPELFVPKDSNRDSIEFWARLLPWVNATFFRVGPAAYEKLADICGVPPGVSGIPKPDLWRIIGTLSARPFVGDQTGSRDLSGLDSYEPFWGDVDNKTQLIADLGKHPDSFGVVIGTDVHVWANGLQSWANTHLAFEPSSDLDEARLASWLFSGAGTLKELEDRAAELFPRLVIHGAAWSHVDKMQLDPAMRLEVLARALAVLNAHASSIFDQYDSPRDRQSAFGSRGLNVAPENGNVHADAAAMRRRRFVFDDVPVTCEWHVRLQRHTDRIYFSVDGDRVHVGDMTDHL